ncbi:MAG: hypothetical protein AB7S83_03660 [Candidatus Methanomethylophilaceae archaeon]|jgi:hypothetical protein
MAARKSKSVVSMMLVAVVIVIVVASLGYVTLKDYEATYYEYEVSGTHQYENIDGYVVTTGICGTVTTTYMEILGETRVTATSSITYHDSSTDTDKPYQLEKRWSFASSPDFGTLTESIEAYPTLKYGDKDVHVYVQIDDESEESVTRWVGQEDGIIYRVERTIPEAGMTTVVIQDLRDYGPTKMPLDL